MDLFSDPAQIGLAFLSPLNLLAASPVFRLDGMTTGGSATITMPTHDAPAAGEKSLLIGFTTNNITDIGGATPPIPTGANWIATGIAGEETSSTQHAGITVFVKYATTAAESFGTTGTGTQRIGCISVRVRPAPVDPLSLINIAGATFRRDSGSNTDCLWPGLTTFLGSRSRVVTCQLTPQIGATGNHVTRSEIQVANGGLDAKFVSGTGSIGITAERSSFAEATTTLGAVSRDIGVCFELRHPADI